VGRVPPQAIDIEKAILGACMSFKAASDIAVSVLKHERVFYRNQHQRIFSVIKDLKSEGIHPDILVVVNELKKRGDLDDCGGPSYVASLTDSVVSTSNMDTYCRVLVEKYMLREVIITCATAARDAYDPDSDAFDLSSRVVKDIYDAVNSHVTGGLKGLNDVFRELNRKIEATADSGYSGFPSMLEELDKITGGFQDGNLIVAAGRPGMGKSSFLERICRSAFLQGKKAAVFHLEMTAIQFVARLVSPLARLSVNEILKVTTSVDELFSKLSVAYSEYTSTKIGEQIFIDDSPGNIEEIIMKCRNLHAQEGLDIIMIDYAQLVEPTDKKVSREQQVSEISRRLKALAKDLDLPIILLAQLSRNVENRGGDRMPMLSDLRESGSLEQDADMVLFFWRPYYYYLQTRNDSWRLMDMGDGRQINTEDYAAIIIAKNRNGGLGMADVAFVAKYTMFDNAIIKSDGTVKARTFDAFKDSDNSNYHGSNPYVRDNDEDDLLDLPSGAMRPNEEF
jgi:replicative DNA helicase